MIQAANVGVGIVGKEGNQASLAADFSITQFSHLTRLICTYSVFYIFSFDVTNLLHLYLKYGMAAIPVSKINSTYFRNLSKLIDKRSARLAHFVIQRGLVISLIQAVFSAIFYFAAIAIYNVRIHARVLIPAYTNL